MVMETAYICTFVKANQPFFFKEKQNKKNYKEIPEIKNIEVINSVNNLACKYFY